MAEKYVRWKCPICEKPPNRYFKSLRGLAQHLAMMKDEAHKNWRINQSVQANYETMKEVLRMRLQIMGIIEGNLEDYKIDFE